MIVPLDENGKGLGLGVRVNDDLDEKDGTQKHALKDAPCKDSVAKENEIAVSIQRKRDPITSMGNRRNSLSPPRERSES
jgi:hypothetical protein